ncbi:TPA: hypothetical protein UOC34_000125 [Stenotrophomonas maltophilia]|nr:hypothetical protein [Stenotrophomonas maltophilia]HEL5081985.1 hypothetical protein [Stenotrophomonas maltophilia]
MSALSVFSGDCLKAVCGIDTGHKDMHGNSLHTGDIVQVYTENYGPDELTVVVGDEWTTYSNGTIERNAGPVEYFVMGIKGVPLEDTGEWRVRKLKGFEEVVLGEHWRAYGFNYRATPDAVIAQGGAA